MRIDEVEAGSFGPFHERALGFAPGLTIVHGANEAGKSSWFAAIHAGLCCRRSARGRPTREQAEFEARHSPWQQGRWSAGVSVTLDDGSRYRIVSDLKGANVAVEDLGHGRVDSVAALEQNRGVELEYDGAFDGSMLLGLNRDSVRATIFVAQADVLRVLEQADALQEFLQRAATSTVVDTTAEAGLQWLAEHARKAVGQSYVGKRPLRRALQEVEDSRQHADDARDAHHELREVLTARRRAQEEVGSIDSRVTGLQAVVEWQELDDLGRRVELARTLVQTQSRRPEAPGELVSPNVRQLVSEAIGAFRERGQEPTTLPPPTAADLEQELTDLPVAPDGDIEPAVVVTRAHQEVVEARSALASHVEDEVALPAPAESLLSPDDLRESAGILEQEPPEVDDAVRTRLDNLRQKHESAVQEHQLAVRNHEDRRKEHEARTANYRREMERYEEDRRQHDELVTRRDRARAATPSDPASTMSMPLVLGGGLVALTGVVAGVLVAPAAYVLVLIGIGLAVLGWRAGRGQHARTTGEATPNATPLPSPPAPPTAPVDAPPPPPQPPTLPADIPRLEERLEAQQAMVASQGERRAATEDRLRQLDLPHASDELRGLARNLEGLASDRVRHDRWAARRADLDVNAESAEVRLRNLLRQRPGSAVDSSSTSSAGSDVDRAYKAYLDGCRSRAEQAKRASRRKDLEDKLVVRRDREQALGREVAAWRGAGQAIRDIAGSLDVEGDDPATLSVELERWLGTQDKLQEASQTRREDSARLEQLLDGRTLEQLEQEYGERQQAAGPRPDVPVDNADQDLATWSHRLTAASDRASDLGGRIVAMQASMPSVAEAIEREAAAERELDRVEQLQTALELAQQHLQEAKERVNATIAPALEATMRPWLPRLTDGRYDDVRIDPETLAVEVLDPDGTFRPAALLSHGTTEQLYLLLRLALAQHLAVADETAPVILDDVTVQSDVSRTIAMLELLHDLSRDRQVIMFTQEQEVVDWAGEHLRPDLDSLVGLDAS